MSSFYNYKCTPFTWHKVGDLYQIDNEFNISLDNRINKYIVTILPGFRTDGGSVPKVFQWFMKGWNNDYRYNGIFVLHDALYCAEYTTKEIADDMLRSSLRDYGFDRFHASTVCWCVNTFAKSHYGKENDENDNYDFVKFNVVPFTQFNYRLISSK